jgi:hypothetical protein
MSAYTSGHQGIWDEYMRELQPAAARVPYMVCPGNHEHYFNFSGYKSRFGFERAASSPESLQQSRFGAAIGHSASNSDGGSGGGGGDDNLWYSFDFGNVHFTMFSTEHNHSAGSPQLAWIAADLDAARSAKAAGSIDWIIMLGHKPMYCSTNDYYDCKIGGPKYIMPFLEPLMSGVDLYLAGHLHNYERSYPVHNGTVTSRNYTDPTSTVHVVAGMAGCDEGLTNKWETPTPEWSAVRDAKLGYGLLTVDGKASLKFEYLLSPGGALPSDQQVQDTFTITRSGR